MDSDTQKIEGFDDGDEPPILVEREHHRKYDEHSWADDAEIKGY